MRWPWTRPKPDPEAMAEARRHLAEAHAREERVNRVVAETKRQMRENGFAPRFARILEEKRR